MPFIANNGQVDEQVEFYAKTFGGAVYVTKDGEIVYALPKTEKSECRLGEAERTQQSNPKSTNSDSPNPKSAIQNLSPTSIGDTQLEYGFTVASYDRTKPLIIDPLLASTHLGGSSTEVVEFSLTLDKSGNVYVTGYTDSANFPTTSGASDTSYNGDYDVFVSKLDGNLSAASGCDGEVKTVETDTGDFELLKLASKVVTVTVTDGGGCPVADVKVSAKINAAGKKRIGISPSSKTTDENGKAAFTITAKEKTGKAKVTFKAGCVTKQITVTVVK